jgi:hypothetical protein
VVVRAWLEPESAADDIRARVLVLRGAQAETDEIGAAAGLEAVLSLVRDALVSIARAPR